MLLLVIVISFSTSQFSGGGDVGLASGFDVAPALIQEGSSSSLTSPWSQDTQQATLQETEVPVATNCMVSTADPDPVDLPSEISSQAVISARCSCPPVWAPCTSLLDKLRARLEPICLLSRRQCERELK
jgi:hypothetical protein